MRLLKGLWLVCAAVAAHGTTLEEGFAVPPHDVRPQAWWWFSTFQEASEACITRALEAMKTVGFAVPDRKDRLLALSGMNPRVGPHGPRKTGPREDAVALRTARPREASRLAAKAKSRVERPTSAVI